MAARKYETKACPIHGQGEMRGANCRAVVERTSTHVRYCHMEEPVTAYDARDVDPMVEAARSARTLMEEGKWGDAHAALETDLVRQWIDPADSEEKT